LARKLVIVVVCVVAFVMPRVDAQTTTVAPPFTWTDDYSHCYRADCVETNEFDPATGSFTVSITGVGYACSPEDVCPTEQLYSVRSFSVTHTLETPADSLQYSVRFDRLNVQNQLGDVGITVWVRSTSHPCTGGAGYWPSAVEALVQNLQDSLTLTAPVHCRTPEGGVTDQVPVTTLEIGVHVTTSAELYPLGPRDFPTYRSSLLRSSGTTFTAEYS
jgi:hypothetical protein